MLTKPKRQKLPKPSVFKHQGRWVCEYYTFDESNGKATPHRKSFIRELKRGGKSPSVSEQRKTALTFRDRILSEIRETERLERREKEQVYLTLKEMKEAKAAFAIFREIPTRNKSLVDAVIQYRDNLKLSKDTPPLKTCIEIFVERKRKASELEDRSRRISSATYRTIKQRLGHLMTHFESVLKRPNIKIGEVTSKHLISYLEGLEVGERTRKNYIADLSNFFNDASDPKDKHRFIDENPMDGVYVHYKKHSHSKSLKYTRTQRSIPKILQLPDVKHVLDVAFEMRDKGMLGFTIAGLYLYMRPSEVFDLVSEENFWDKYIKLEEGIVRIDGFGKIRDQRTIVISENCRAWLQYIKDENLPFCFPKKKNGQNLQYANFRARAFLPAKSEELLRIRRLHKTGKKPSADEKAFMEECNKELQEFEDVLRHTGGTNLYYECGFDTNYTVAQMGNSGEIFIGHYRGLLNHPEDHNKFRSFRPEEWTGKKEKVIKFG